MSPPSLGSVGIPFQTKQKENTTWLIGRMFWKLGPAGILQITVEKFDLLLHLVHLLPVLVEDVLADKVRSFELLT